VAREFTERIADRGVPVTVRDTRGTQIDGACGQLAATGRIADPVQDDPVQDDPVRDSAAPGGRTALRLTPR
jgi:hypothetical protein